MWVLFYFVIAFIVAFAGGMALAADDYAQGLFFLGSSGLITIYAIERSRRARRRK